MITETILVIFAIVYYLFSIFFVSTILRDKDEDDILLIIAYFLCTIYLSPIATPIILGIEIGQAIRKNCYENKGKLE